MRENFTTTNSNKVFQTQSANFSQALRVPQITTFEWPIEKQTFVRNIYRIDCATGHALSFVTTHHFVIPSYTSNSKSMCFLKSLLYSVKTIVNTVTFYFLEVPNLATSRIAK